MTKLHIEFSVREPESERYVTFVDDVQPIEIQNWFQRVALGIEQLFSVSAEHGPCGIVMKGPGQGPVERIAAIRLVRELAVCGLREAKDAVDASDDITPFLICDDAKMSAIIADKFKRLNIIVDIMKVDTSTFAPKAQRVQKF